MLSLSRVIYDRRVKEDSIRLGRTRPSIYSRYPRFRTLRHSARVSSRSSKPLFIRHHAGRATKLFSASLAELTRETCDRSCSLYNSISRIDRLEVARGSCNYPSTRVYALYLFIACLRSRDPRGNRCLEFERTDFRQDLRSWFFTTGERHD